MINICIRTAVIYLVLIISVRLMGKRQVGQMETSELVVTMLAADLAALPIGDDSFPLITGLMTILVLVGLETLLSLGCMRSIWFRKFLCGKPVILIDNGKILEKNLHQTRVTLDELTEMLRMKDVLDPKSVQFAILETNGNLSVFPYPAERPASCREAGIQTKPQYLPITIVSDGKIMKANLSLAGKDENWVHRVLKQRGATLGQTLLMTVDKTDHVAFYPKEGFDSRGKSG